MGITKNYITALLTLLVLIVPEVNSQSSFGWRWLHPRPEGNSLYWVKVFDANNWYAGGKCGTFMKTTNAGSTWVFNLNAGWRWQEPYYFGGARRDSKTSWFFDQNTGIVAGVGSGILRTTNAGLAFDTISILPDGFGTINNVVFANSLTGYLCGSSVYGIMKTVNGGINWVTCSAPSDTYYALYVWDANNVISSSESGPLQRTTDGGNTWNEISISGNYIYQDIKFNNSLTGYACTGYGGFRFSTDGGYSWNMANTPNNSYKNQLVKVVISGNTVFVAGNDTNIYKTTNNGTTWDSVRHYSSGQYYTYQQYDLSKSGNTMVLVGNAGNISRSTDNGVSWTNLNVRKSLATFSAIHVESSTGNIWVAGGATGFNDAIIYSSNGGVNWVTQNAQTTMDIYDIEMINSNTGYICGLGGLIKKTTNAGLNWVTVTAPLTSEYGYSALDFIDINTGWIVGGWTSQLSSSSCIIKTTNGGNNFTVQVPANDKALSSVQFVDVNTGWACGKETVTRTTNGGNNWILVNPPNPVSTIYLSLKAFNGNTAIVCGQNSSIFRTTNGGTSWDSIPSPTYSLTWFATDWINQNTGIVGGSNGATARTTNGGQTWYLTNTGAGESVQNVVMKAVDTIFACSYNSQFLKSTESIVTNILKYENTNPGKYHLEQNYPNPFNPSTTIKFSLPKASVISLKVYDVTGREVAELINSENLNRGTFSYNFSSSQLSSGIYFYSLIADNKISDTKKMIIIK